jgi:hypothetical protein
MQTKEIKKGMRVRLRNGWFGTMAENCRGNTPMVTVEGFCTETGSVYVFDIARVRTNLMSGNEMDEETWENVELTDKQKNFQEQVMAMGF